MKDVFSPSAVLNSGFSFCVQSFPMCTEMLGGYRAQTKMLTPQQEYYASRKVCFPFFSLNVHDPAPGHDNSDLLTCQFTY